MSKRETRSLISFFFQLYGFATALIVVAFGYFDYYKSVVAPVESKQGYVVQMLAIGLVVFAAALCVCYLTRNRIRISERVAPAFPLLFAGMLALIPVGTPYVVSLISAGRLYWMTPTIVGNALIIQYAVFILVMLFGGLAFGTAFQRKAAARGMAAAAMPALFLLTAVTAALMLTVIPSSLGKDSAWWVLAAFTAVCSVVSMLTAPAREK